MVDISRKTYERNDRETIVENKFFNFKGKICKTIDGVALGFPLGPVLANAFLCLTVMNHLNHNRKRHYLFTYLIYPFHMNVYFNDIMITITKILLLQLLY